MISLPLTCAVIQHFRTWFPCDKPVKVFVIVFPLFVVSSVSGSFSSIWKKTVFFRLVPPYGTKLNCTAPLVSSVSMNGLLLLKVLVSVRSITETVYVRLRRLPSASCTRTTIVFVPAARLPPASDVNVTPLRPCAIVRYCTSVLLM